MVFRRQIFRPCIQIDAMLGDNRKRHALDSEGQAPSVKGTLGAFHGKGLGKRHAVQVGRQNGQFLLLPRNGHSVFEFHGHALLVHRLGGKIGGEERVI